MHYVPTEKGGAPYHAALPAEGIDEADLVDWLALELYRDGERVTAWTPQTMRLLATDCVEHVLYMFQAVYPDDEKVGFAIEAARPRRSLRAAASARESQMVAEADARSWDARRSENWGAAASGRNQDPGYVSTAEQIAKYTAAALVAQAAALAASCRGVVELRPCLIACQQAAGHAIQIGIPWVNVALPELGRYGPPTRVILWPEDRGRREREGRSAEKYWQNARLLELIGG